MGLSQSGRGRERGATETKIDEIADGIYRLSTLVPEVAPPHGFTFNQFLILADEPLLFHCGQRGLFSIVSAAVAMALMHGSSFKGDCAAQLNRLADAYADLVQASHH